VQEKFLRFSEATTENLALKLGMKDINNETKEDEE